MDNSLLYILMTVGGLLMSVIPFAVFMGFGTLFKYSDVNLNLMIALFCLSIVFAFGISFASFVVMQKTRCGKVQDFGRISKFAGISTAIHTGVMILASVLGFLKNIVRNLMPPDTDNLVVESTTYGYYSLWGILFGLAFGGNMSAICV